MDAISSQRIDQIYQEMLKKADQRGQDWTSYSQYEAKKMRVMAEVWKKYAEAGDNPFLLAEAKKFEAENIHQLDTDNINNLKMGGVSSFTINDEQKQAEDRYHQMLAQVNGMRGDNAQGSSGPKFGEDGWWDSFNKYIHGLIGQGPHSARPDGIPADPMGQNQGKIGMDFGYWASLFYMGFNTIKDGDGNYLAHPELVPGIPETGLNEESTHFGAWTGPGGIDAALMNWEKQKLSNSNLHS